MTDLPMLPPDPNGQDAQNPLLSNRARRNVRRKAGEFASNAAHRSEMEELFDIKAEIDAARPIIQQNMETITEEMANTMTRAYLANPHLNPEMIVSAVFAGADEATIYQMATEVAEVQSQIGLYGDDSWERIESQYPWAAHFKDDLRRNQVGEVFRPDYADRLGIDQIDQPTEEWWKAQVGSRWYGLLREPRIVADGQGGVRLEVGDPKSLGPMGEKISPAEAERRRPPEVNVIERMVDWAMRRVARDRAELPPVVEIGEEIEGAATLGFEYPNIAMVTATDLADTLLAPVRFALDKVTPDFVSDPVSDVIRGTTRWGFAGVQMLTDMPENLIMSATADPTQAHLGFRNQIAQKGVLRGLGSGLANSFFATGFGQATQDLFDGGGVDTGSGFFMGGTAQEEADKLKMFTLGYYTDEDNKYFRTRSFGTFSAEYMSQLGVIDRDSFAYNVISGGIDAAYELFLDPTNYVPFAGWSDEAVAGLKQLDSSTANKVADFLEESRRLDDKALKEPNPAIADALRAMSDNEARNALEAAGIDTRALDRAAVRARLSNTSDQELAVRSFLLDEAGVIRDGERRTVTMPEFAKFLITGRGRRLVQRIQEVESPYQMKQLFRGRIGNVTATRLADATNPEDVVRILVEGISNPNVEMMSWISRVPNVGLFSLSDKGLWIRRNLSPVTRMGNVLPPGSVVDPTDGDEFVSVVSQILSVLPTDPSIVALRRYDMAKREEILDRFIRAFASGNQGEVKAAISKFAEEMTEVFVGLGYDPVAASALARWVKNQDRLSAFRWSDLASDAPIDTMPLLFGDLLSSQIEILDSNKMLTAIRQSGRVRSVMRQFANMSPDLKKLEQLRLEWLRLREAGLNDDADKLIEKMRKLHDKINAKKNDNPLAVMEKGAIAWSTRLADGVNDWWKTFQTVRPAYVLRVVPEENARVMLTGVFNNWVDYLATMITSFEKLNKGRAGRYVSDIAGRNFVRTTRKSQELQIKWEALRDELSELQKAGKGATPRAQRVAKEMDDVAAQFDRAIEEWDAGMKSYQEAMIGRDRTQATRALTRKRGKSAIARNSTGLANRNNRSQVQNWVQGMMERVTKLSNDAGGAQDIARAHIGIDVGSQYTFDMNGVVGTVKQHLARGEDFVDVMAHHYVLGGGALRYRQYVRALNADGAVIDPADITRAKEWVSDVVREIEYVAGRNPNMTLFPNIGSKAFEFSDPDIMRAIATGRFKGMPLQSSQNVSISQRTSAYSFNGAFRDHVELFGLNPNAPNQVVYNTGLIMGEEAIGAMETIANAIFGFAYGVSSDILNRSPAFRRIYWKQATQFIRSASPEAGKEILANARKAKLPKNMIKQLEANSRMALGDLSTAEVDEISKAAALRDTVGLLYDANRRGATADALRLVVSFGDAWYETLKVWSQANLNRAGAPTKSLMKGISGMRDFSLFGEMVPTTTWEYDPETNQYNQVTSQKRKGFFYKDPTSEQWMYGLPMSNSLIRNTFGAAAGMDVGPGGELRSAVEGLNVLGTLSPGVGPFGSIAAQAIIPNDPKMDWLMDILYPVVRPIDPQEQEAADIGASGLLTPYARRALIALGETAPSVKSVINLLYNYERDPQFINVQVNIAKALDSSGQYSWDADGRRRLREDTRKAATNLMGIMAIAAFVGPGAPSFRHLLQTKDPETGEIMGNMVGHQFAQELNDLRRLYVDLGEDPNQAVNDMLYYYGPEVELSVVPNSNSQFQGQEQTQEWWDWYRTGSNQTFIETYPLVGAFFGAVNGERDNDVANEMRAAGLTSPKSLEELDADARRLRAYRRYNQFLKNNGLDGPEARRTDEQRVAIARYREELEKYYDVALNDRTSQNERERQLGQLQRMIDLYRSEDVADAEARALVVPHIESQFGQAVMAYMDMRAAVQEAGIKFLGLGPDGWRQSFEAASLRDRLRETGAALSRIDPAFSRLYQFVLEREMLMVEDEQLPEIRVGEPVGLR